MSVDLSNVSTEELTAELRTRTNEVDRIEKELVNNKEIRDKFYNYVSTVITETTYRIDLGPVSFDLQTSNGFNPYFEPLNISTLTEDDTIKHLPPNLRSRYLEFLESKLPEQIARFLTFPEWQEEIVENISNYLLELLQKQTDNEQAISYAFDKIYYGS